jgi:flagellar hook-associated protein 2
MNNLIGIINADKTAGLTAFYDEATDKMVFDSKYSGNNNTAGNDILLSGNFLITALGLSVNTDGTDAAFTINGLDTTRKTNSFTINGVTLNIQSKSDTPVSVTVSQNVNDVFDQIKGFVDLYNETIADINTKVAEKRDRDYQPLVQEEKDEMSDKEVELWESKAKAGLLNGDSILKSVTSSMRRSLYDKVDGASDTKLDQLSEIGITTSVLYQENGKLEINEAKLKDAIANNSDKVIELFTKASTATDSAQKYRESGIMTRLYTNITNSIDNITEKAGQENSFSLYDKSILGKQISNLSLDISDFEDKLADKETAYYNRFAALESYMTNMNTQSSWLSQQMK